ncbi:MAG: carbohydrate binding family 9 domain-containing protein [Gemmatimonadetes bacterium]|nr:carbohydrate binding family 9 domain-containing protein [Gemmatimonadota bacterium]
MPLVVAVGCLALPLPSSLWGQLADGGAEATRKQLRAVRINALPAPRLDGRLDDAAWAVAEFTADFTAKQPVEGAAPLGRTEAAFLYDDHALYIGARMLGARPGDVRALLTRRDQWGSSEVVVFALDSYLDRRTAYAFGVTAAGVRIDFFQPTDVEGSRDFGYEPVWDAKASVDSTGWVAELRIPFSQLRFNHRDVQVWGLNISRYVPARNEDLFWVMVPRTSTGWSSRFGNLVGIEGIRPSRRLELLPYAAGNATATGNRDPANPFDDGRNLSARMGGDLKMGLGPNLTVEATVNPDFGQVEADPAQVNLTAFETIFSERRPFFVEGHDLLDGGGKDYFYSRRIGAPPRGGASARFVDRPLNSTILGAAKLTGRLRSGLAIGALAAVTDAESARTYTPGAGSFGSVPVEPRTGYGVFRVRKQFGPNQSTGGLMLTGVNRGLAPGDPLAALATRDAYAAATDWNLRFSGGRYQLSAYTGWTLVRGDAAAITRLQRSSARYFQRPDATHVRFDSTRTALPGYVYGARFEKSGGRHWFWSLFAEVETPGHERNDLGRLQTADNFDTNVNLRYRENRPGPTFYNYSISGTVRNNWNTGWVKQVTGGSLDLSATLRNYVSFSLDLDLNARALSDRVTRGGPLMGTPANWRLDGRVGSNSRLTTVGELEGQYGRDELGGWNYEVSMEFSARPLGSVSFSVDPGYARSLEPRQYLTSRSAGRPETYGRRYIFGAVERSTLSADIRASYVMSPDLTLELYAQPFVSTGRYSRFGELGAARSRDLRLYGEGGSSIVRNADGSRTVTDGLDTFTLANPDFTVRSFRSNLVLRWEWRRGSTLYLVWQQNRGSSLALGDPVTPRDWWDAFTATGDNFLAVKLSYWLPVD